MEEVLYERLDNLLERQRELIERIEELTATVNQISSRLAILESSNGTKPHDLDIRLSKLEALQNRATTHWDRILDNVFKLAATIAAGIVLWRMGKP